MQRIHCSSDSWNGKCSNTAINVISLSSLFDHSLVQLQSIWCTKTSFNCPLIFIFVFVLTFVFFFFLFQNSLFFVHFTFVLRLAFDYFSLCLHGYQSLPFVWIDIIVKYLTNFDLMTYHLVASVFCTCSCLIIKTRQFLFTFSTIFKRSMSVLMIDVCADV